MVLALPLHAQAVLNSLSRGLATVDDLLDADSRLSAGELHRVLQRFVKTGVLLQFGDCYRLAIPSVNYEQIQGTFWAAAGEGQMGCGTQRQAPELPVSRPSGTAIIPELVTFGQMLERETEPISMDYLAHCCMKTGVRGHLAILTQPYLNKIMAGKKTIESRFSKVRCPPFEQIQRGEIVVLKECAGPIVGVATVAEAEFFGPLAAGDAVMIMRWYESSLCLEQSFIAAKETSTYVTLAHLGAVHAVRPRQLTKTDRRGWVVLPQTRQPSAKLSASDQSYNQLPLLVTHPHCIEGLHRYDNPKNGLNTPPRCRYCGAQTVDWEGMHLCNIATLNIAIKHLRTDAFRNSWWTKDIDERARAHALRKGRKKLRESVRARLVTSIGRVHEFPDGIKRPYRDGLQTPYQGNSIYYAQHALACCCRKCIYTWHGIPNGRDLTEQELNYLEALVMQYIAERLPELDEYGISVPRQRRH